MSIFPSLDHFPNFGSVQFHQNDSTSSYSAACHCIVAPCDDKKVCVLDMLPAICMHHDLHLSIKYNSFFYMSKYNERMNNTVTRSNCSTSKQNDLTKCGQRQPSRMQMQRTCDLSFPTISQHLFSRHLQATWTNIDRGFDKSSMLNLTSYELSDLIWFIISTSDSLFRVYHGSASIHSHLQSGGNFKIHVSLVLQTFGS